MTLKTCLTPAQVRASEEDLSLLHEARPEPALAQDTKSYRILVSGSDAQQTQVERVTEKYKEFSPPSRFSVLAKAPHQSC
jgi:adenine-specific DNA glycosylase